MQQMLFRNKLTYMSGFAFTNWVDDYTLKGIITNNNTFVLTFEQQETYKAMFCVAGYKPVTNSRFLLMKTQPFLSEYIFIKHAPKYRMKEV